MANETDIEANRILDRHLGPSWRANARDCGEFWRRMFQTPSDRTIEAMRLEAYQKWLGKGGAT